MRPALTVTLFQRAAEALGATVLLESFAADTGGLVTFRNGRRLLLTLAPFGFLNPSAAIAFTRDRHCTDTILNQLGYPMPISQLATPTRAEQLTRAEAIDLGYRIGRSLGRTFVLRPSMAGSGNLSAYIQSRANFDRAANAIFAMSHNLYIQRWYPGDDYCLLIFEQQVLLAYQRAPSGLTSRWEAIDKTGRIAPELCELAITACNELGLRLASVDLIAPRQRRYAQSAPVITQISAEPDLLRFAQIGAHQARTIGNLYSRALQIAEQSNIL